MKTSDKTAPCDAFEALADEIIPQCGWSEAAREGVAMRLSELWNDAIETAALACESEAKGQDGPHRTTCESLARRIRLKKVYD